MELLERSPFLDALAGYAAEARQGSGRLVLVSGESGIGKTALVEAFQAQLDGARWLWGACDGLLTPRPLGPLFDIAAQAGGQLAELWAQGPGCGGGSAVRGVPARALGRGLGSLQRGARHSGCLSLYPLRILGTIRGRRGEPGHTELLDSSAALAAGIVSPVWVTEDRAVRAELLWVSGQADLARQEAREAYEQALGRVDPWKLGSLAIWLWRRSWPRSVSRPGRPRPAKPPGSASRP